MHERTSHDTSNCSIARTLDIVGEKWTFLILREAMYGVTRFADFLEVLRCPRNLLAERLHMLVAQGIFAVEPYKEPGDRTRSQYILTTKGDRLISVLVALVQFGDEYLADPAGPAIQVNHRGCGHRVHVEMVCECGHKPQSGAELEITPGPAFRLATTAR
ncbi:helix-turn-helix domain-containing protein [Nocardia sp. NPDC049190]|uniref:winged helix-turn-helix transcriptional regulator n=1 Tax=Nocardia sp. NPDC049190 TaxID=3155650 RepID=UPI0034113558